MTEDQLDHLRLIVRIALRDRGLVPGSTPEYDDALAEAYLAAWRAVSRMSASSPHSWKTIAARAGYWGAQEYLASKRSGRMAWKALRRPSYLKRRGREWTEAETHAQEAPWSLSDIPESVYERSWDGGFAAADARLELWLLRPPLSLGERQVFTLLYRHNLSMTESARRLGISYSAFAERYRRLISKYRIAAGLAAP